MRFWKFLQYNNAVPIALTVLVLGGGSAFAATDPAAVYSAQQQVVSIDNTYIANKDLSTYSPQAQITGVTEDTDNYYVAYDFSTIDLVNSTWQDTTKQLTLKVSKDSLAGTDLGLYVAEQLKQNVDAEVERLKNTQEIEKKNVTQKVVATVYGGLIGKMLSASTETIPGYTPVIAPVLPSLASDATTTDANAAAAALTLASTTSNSSQQQPLTQEQIQLLIQQQVNLLLAQNAASSTPSVTTNNPPPPSGGGTTPPPADTATTTPTQTATTTSSTTATTTAPTTTASTTTPPSTPPTTTASSTPTTTPDPTPTPEPDPTPAPTETTPAPTPTTDASSTTP